MDIQWKRGNFLKFISVLKIRVGGQNPFDIMPQDEFEFDGTICKYAGSETAHPQMRGAIRENWAVLDGSAAQDVEAFSPARAVAKSQTKGTDLSRVQRTQPQRMSQDSLDEEVVLNVSDRQSLPKDERGRITGHLTQDDNRRTGFRAPSNPNAGRLALDYKQSEVDQQDGVVIARVKSPSSMKVDIMRQPGAARDIELRSVDSGFGRAGGIRKSHVHQEGIDIGMNVGSVDRNVIVGDESDGRHVGNVRHSSNGRSAEGVTVKDTSGIRNPKAPNRPPAKAAPARKPAPAKAAKKPIPTKKPAPAKAPAPLADLKGLPPNVRVARRIDPSFPKSWSFEGKLAERLERVKKHGVSPQFLEALYAAEGDQMRKILEREFPQHFNA